MRPCHWETLYLYLSVSEQATTSVLIKESEDKQLLVYFISQILGNAEARYPYIEKLAYDLVISTQGLF